MSAYKPLCELAGVTACQFSREENLLIEMNLFTYFCSELIDKFRVKYDNYFQILKLDKKKESAFMETGFVCYVIQDILSSNEYSLSGIARYANLPEDVIHDILTGTNSNPSASVLRKIIELHRSVRPILYNSIMAKLFEKGKSSTPSSTPNIQL